MIKDKKLIYNYLADQKTKNKFINNEVLKLLDETQLPEYILNNKAKLEKWFSK